MESFYKEEEQYYNEEEPVLIIQNLNKEQHQFQFPSHSTLESLAYLDQGENRDTFFDSTSFTAVLCNMSTWHETDNNPSAISRKSSFESIQPSSFQESLSTKTNELRVLVRLNKQKCNSPITIIRYTTTASTIDEGYDDDNITEDDGKELESECHFYSIQDDLDLLRDKAAIKIQSLWRGYISRRNNNNKQSLMFQLAHLCGTIHKRQMNQFQKRMDALENRVNKVSQLEKRIEQLEKRLEQETAMRRAFENTVEDMTVLIDRQQKVLYDRLEEEVSLRQSYEHRMNQALDQIEPLESRLKKEVNARNRVEEMLTRVLDQMHQTETSRLQQIKKDAELRRIMQSKLEQAFEEISHLKSTNHLKSLAVTRETRTPTLNNRRQAPSSPVSRVQIERPSVIPSNRRPTMTPNKRTLSRK
ncbi:hypothetical protein G6F43_008174 [Rhizopus delemar]|nr:hypothetical protein G6F43_008174 [Rhizopus delemar]